MAEKYTPNPKASLVQSKVLAQNATEVSNPLNEARKSCINPSQNAKRNKSNSSSSVGKKPKLSTEAPVQSVKRKTKTQQDILPKKPNIGTNEPSKTQSLPTKKASTSMQSKDLSMNQGNLRPNIRKQTKRTRPLSTEISLSSTSPAVLRNQTGKMAKVKGSSLRHSWHSMPSGLRSTHGSVDPRRTPQRQQKAKFVWKGKSVRVCFELGF